MSEAGKNKWAVGLVRKTGRNRIEPQTREIVKAIPGRHYDVERKAQAMATRLVNDGRGGKHAPPVRGMGNDLGDGLIEWYEWEPVLYDPEADVYGVGYWRGRYNGPKVCKRVEYPNLYEGSRANKFEALVYPAAEVELVKI